MGWVVGLYTIVVGFELTWSDYVSWWDCVEFV